MRKNYLESIGAVKTARREAESLAIAKALLTKTPVQFKDQSRLVEILKTNKVLLRAADVFDLPTEKTEEAKVDAKEAFQLYDYMSKIFENEDIPFVVIKSFDSLPDIGHDLDFLIPSELQFDKAKVILVNKLRANPQDLTHCDKVVGKFSCFLPNFKHDFELYPTISQEGEEHLDPSEILNGRKKDLMGSDTVWVTSDLDRVLIRIVHAMFRHNFLKLSDIIDFLVLIKPCSPTEILDGVDKAGIEDALLFFLATIDRFLKACDIDDQTFQRLVDAAEKRFGQDRLAFLRHDRLVLPYRIPTLALMLVFLLKAGREAPRGRFKSSLRCLIAPPLVLMEFINAVFGQKLLKRIW